MSSWRPYKQVVTHLAGMKLWIESCGIGLVGWLVGWTCSNRTNQTKLLSHSWSVPLKKRSCWRPVVHSQILGETVGLLVTVSSRDLQSQIRSSSRSPWFVKQIHTWSKKEWLSEWSSVRPCGIREVIAGELQTYNMTSCRISWALCNEILVHI